MGNGILGTSKYTVRSQNAPALHPLHLLSLLLTSVFIGILFVALSKTPSLAKTSPKPIEPQFTTIPKANIAYANTIGTDIAQTPTIPPPSTDQLTTQNQTIFPSPEPSETPITSSVSLNADLIFSMINQIRTQNGLPAFQKDDRLCSLAQSRAPEIHNEVLTGTMHQGIYGRHLPYWNNENIIDIATEEQAINFWMSDYVHKAAILGNYQFSCVACSGNACAEEFSNFEAK